MLVSLSHDKARGAVYGFDRFSSAQVYPVSQTWGYTGFLDLKLIRFHRWLQLLVWIHRMSIVPQAGVGRSAWVGQQHQLVNKECENAISCGCQQQFCLSRLPPLVTFCSTTGARFVGNYFAGLVHTL